MTNSNTAPVQRLRIGRLAAAIWKNTSKDGKHYYSFTLDRSYEGQSGKWQSTSSFGLADALALAKLCDLADNKIRDLYEADRQSAQADESPADDNEA